MHVQILKPNEQIIVAATGVALVLGVYANNTPPLADVRADKTGNVNTHASVKMAAITSIGIVGALALIAKSPTVFTVGGAVVIWETWKYHYANYGVNGTAQNAASATY